MGEFVLEKTKNSEYIPSPASLRSVSQSSNNEDNVPILATLKPNDNVPTLVTLKPRDNVRPVVDRYSSDSEGDEVPISQTIQAVKAICNVVPEGEAAVTSFYKSPMDHVRGKMVTWPRFENICEDVSSTRNRQGDIHMPSQKPYR